MVIEKILNNNVVITRNLSGVETVIMGRGLAFGHSAGDEVDESKIEKTFTITSKNNRVEEILAKIPVEHMLISEKVFVMGCAVQFQLTADRSGNKLIHHGKLARVEHNGG